MATRLGGPQSLPRKGPTAMRRGSGKVLITENTAATAATGRYTAHTGGIENCEQLLAYPEAQAPTREEVHARVCSAAATAHTGGIQNC